MLGRSYRRKSNYIAIYLCIGWCEVQNYQELPKLEDSISYIYIEHAVIERSDAAIVAIQEDGKTPIPVAAITCLLLGPGTKITHAAIRALCDNGCMAIWCGERATQFYAAGIGETRSAKNLLLQARTCMDKEQHLNVVKRMYQIRFPHTKTDGLTIQQLRGMEGIRVRKAYESASRSSGVKWTKRTYKSNCWECSDEINRALSQANAMLYGICHAAIVSLGYSPGLGFIHTGKQLSFVYDIADLYKIETTIPAAFSAVKSLSKYSGDLSKAVRVQCRSYFSSTKILSRIAKDIAWVLGGSNEGSDDCQLAAGDLWDDIESYIDGGINYSFEVNS